MTSQGGSGVDDEEKRKGHSWPDCLFVAQLPAPFWGWKRREVQQEDESNQGPARDLGSPAYNMLLWGSSHVFHYK